MKQRRLDCSPRFANHSEVVLLGLYMGLRIGAEALTLKKENVDLENGLLTIEAAYSKNGKTQTMPIHSCLIDPLRVRLMDSTSNYLFPGPKGKPMHDIRPRSRTPASPQESVEKSLHTPCDTLSHPASP